MDIVQQLENLVSTPLDPELFPVKKGNSLLIGDFQIAEAKRSYVVKYKNSTVIGRTKSLLAAVALVKQAKRRKIVFAEIHRLDNLILKQQQDTVFYKDALKKTTDTERKQVLEIKIDNALLKVQESKEKLKGFIFTTKINNFNNLQLGRVT
jgi:hypothetical protein